MQALTAGELTFVNSMSTSGDPEFAVETATFWEDGKCFTCTWIRDLKGQVSTKAHFHSSDSGTVSPIYVPEVAMLCALQSVYDEFLRVYPKMYQIVHIRAGGPRVCRLLGRWINTGSLQLRSAAATPVVVLAVRLSEIARTRPPGGPLFSSGILISGRRISHSASK